MKAVMKAVRTSFLLLFGSILVVAAPEMQNDSITSGSDDGDVHDSFESLRHAIQDQPGGYVHPNLGLLSPAPCGARRGLGWVDSHQEESVDQDAPDNHKDDDGTILRIPLSYQMTRSLALETLIPLIPSDVLKTAPLEELDDAALLVLLLAHEIGLGRHSKFQAYLESLPHPEDPPGCGFYYGIIQSTFSPSSSSSSSIITPDDLQHAMDYMSRVSQGMAADYADYLSQRHWPDDWKDAPATAIAWSLCLVSSRGTASSTGTRLIPVLDLVNHHSGGSGFIEWMGDEEQRKTAADGTTTDPSVVQQEYASDLAVDAAVADRGTFVVRSIDSKGKRTSRHIGTEVMTNYHLQDYTPLDWFLSLGFVPEEVLGMRESEL